MRHAEPCGELPREQCLPCADAPDDDDALADLTAHSAPDPPRRLTGPFAVLGRPCAAHPPSRERPYMYWPPLGLSWEPVNQPPSVQRKRTTAAISSGSPKRPRGI